MSTFSFDYRNQLKGAWDTAGPALIKQLDLLYAQLAGQAATTYAEGIWAPVIGGDTGTSGQAYVTQTGRYIKVGTKVWATFYAALAAKGTISGNVIIAGLPFVAVSTAAVLPVGAVIWSGLNTNWVNVVAVVLNNTTTAALRGATAAATSNNSSLATGDLTNSTVILGTVTYQAAS